MPSRPMPAARSSSASGSSKSWCIAARPSRLASSAHERAMKSLIDVTVAGFTATEQTTLWVIGEPSRSSSRRDTVPSSASMGMS